jgi:tetratricopeptide (TPR) repeat protein
MTDQSWFEDHAFSRYARVTMSVIEALQADYFAGRDLAASMPHIDAARATIIVAESLEADLLTNTLQQRFSKQVPPGIYPEVPSDWTRACLAGVFREVEEMAREQGNQEQEGNWWALAWSSLEAVCRSPFASPLLDYEMIFFDVGQKLRVRGAPEAVDFSTWALAHNLRYHAGSNAAFLLRDLAETYLWVGEAERGLRLFAGLLRDDPSDIWNYNNLALTCQEFGLADLGAQAARRGLELIRETGDPKKLHEQLQDLLHDLEHAEERGREAELDPAALAELRSALSLDFGQGQGRPVVDLCRELVPELDHVSVKQPPPTPDLPPPAEWIRRKQIALTAHWPGRNDPCWCGSGKKYKHCHRRSDQERGR